MRRTKDFCLTKDEILASVVDISEKYRLDHELILAFIEVESGFNPLAIRHEPHWSYPYLYAGYALRLNITADTELMLQSSSWGLMQVMGSVIREQGFTDNLLRVVEHPEVGIEHGCIHLRKIFDKHPSDSLDFVISSYNAGTPKRVGDIFENQAYVNKVKKALEGKVWNNKP